MMIPDWNDFERETQVVLALTVVFVIYRIGVATVSGFGFHQGWNEGHYALIGRGFLHHPLVPRYADIYVYSVPPLFPYTVALSFLAFGQSVVAARLPSILATGGLLLSTYALGRTVFESRQTALLGTGVLSILPYVQLYGGRAQTDILMVCLFTAALTAIIRGYERPIGALWLVTGGALFAAAFAAKQPAILLVPMVLLWLLGRWQVNRKTAIQTGILVGASAVFLLPLIAWFALNYAANPVAFVADWRHELVGRTVPFANVPLLIAIAGGLGITPTVITVALIGVTEDIIETIRRIRTDFRGAGPSILTWWVIIVGVFVLARTPHGHQYYAVALTPPVALFAARGIEILTERLTDTLPQRRARVRMVLVALVIVSAISGTVVLFELSGEFSAAEASGTHVAADAGAFLTTTAPENATILVENGYTPPIRWYVRDELPLSNVEAYRLNSLSRARITAAINASNGPVYLVVPNPAWGNVPTAGATEVYRTPMYDYTVMAAIGSVVETDSKFTYYLNKRQLVIYRFDTTSQSIDNKQD